MSQQPVQIITPHLSSLICPSLGNILVSCNMMLRGEKIRSPIKAKYGHVYSLCVIKSVGLVLNMLCSLSCCAELNLFRLVIPLLLVLAAQPVILCEHLPSCSLQPLNMASCCR